MNDEKAAIPEIRELFPDAALSLCANKEIFIEEIRKVKITGAKQIRSEGR